MNFISGYTPEMINAIRQYRIDQGYSPIINPFIPYIQEQWRPVLIPDIDPDAYQISSFGRVYSNMTRQFLIPINRNGYQTVMFMTIDDRRVIYAVHRLVAAMFIYHSDYTKNVINHIDGNPSNNAIWNLEWVTQQQNVYHAFKIGLAGNNQPKLEFNSEDVHEICKLLEKGVSFDDIANQYTASYPDSSFSVIRSKVSKIARHQIYTDISDQYNIEHNNNHSTQNMTLEDINKLCYLLQQGADLGEIMDAFDMPDNMRVWLKDFISKIMNKKVFADISDQYTDLKYPKSMQPKKHRLTSDQEAQIVSLLKEGKRSNEIFYALFGKSWKEIPLNDYYSFKTSVQNIKRKHAGELS